MRHRKILQRRVDVWVACHCVRRDHYRRKTLLAFWRFPGTRHWFADGHAPDGAARPVGVVGQPADRIILENNPRHDGRDTGGLYNWHSVRCGKFCRAGEDCCQRPVARLLDFKISAAGYTERPGLEPGPGAGIDPHDHRGVSVSAGHTAQASGAAGNRRLAVINHVRWTLYGDAIPRW